VPSLLIYQVNDGPVQDIPIVYDRGIPLTTGSNYATYALLAAAVVSAGTYATCLAQGFFRLGAASSGTITADVKGDNDSSYVETSADIVRRILGTKTSLVDPTDFDVGTFTSTNTAQPAVIGYWADVENSLTVADVCADIMSGIGGWLGFTRTGKIYTAIFTAPSGSPVDSFGIGDVIGSVKRERLPDSIMPAVWRWRVAYQRSWTTQDDLAGGVTAARKSFVADQFRLAEAASTAIKVDHPLAIDAQPIESFFATKVAAQAEATRLLALYGTTRKLYRIPLGRRALLLKLGNVISITFPRWDLSVGRLVTVLEINETVSKDSIDTVEVVCYG
jgi:hypothetical protein